MYKEESNVRLSFIKLYIGKIRSSLEGTSKTSVNWINKKFSNITSNFKRFAVSISSKNKNQKFKSSFAYIIVKNKKVILRRSQRTSILGLYQEVVNITLHLTRLVSLLEIIYRMDICPLCKKKVRGNDVGIACDGCDMWHHYDCLPQPKKKFEILEKLPKFYCTVKCKHEDLAKSNSNIAETLKKILDSISEIQESIRFQTEQYNDIKKEVAETNKDILELKKENHEQNMKIQQLQVELNSINQEKLNKTLISFGVQQQNNETPKDAIYRELLRLKISPDGIHYCFKKKAKLFK